MMPVRAAQDPPLNLIGVIRLSTDEQARDGKEGIGRQKDAIQKVAQELGANIVRTVELIESGSHMIDNAEMQKVFDELGHPGIDGVAVSQVDRLVRSDKCRDFTVFDPFQRHQKKICIPGRIIEPYSQTGFMETLLLGMFGGIEKILIRDRTMGARERIRRKGIPIMGWCTLPDGVSFDEATGKWSYDLDPDAKPKHVIGKKRRYHPGFALQVREAFRMLVDEDLSLRAIGRVLGGRDSRNVALLLSNRIWIGFRQYRTESAGEEHTSKNGHRYRRRFPKANPWEIPVITEPLIPVEMFNRAQEILARRRVQWGQRAAPTKSPLTGVLWCGCGKRIYAGKNHYYCASRYGSVAQCCGLGRMRSDLVEGAVMFTVGEQLLRPEVLDAVVAAHQRMKPSPQHQSARDRALAGIRQAERDFGDLLQSREITLKEYRERKRKLAAERVALDALHPKDPEPTWGDPATLRETLVKALVFFGTTANEGLRRDVLRRAVRRIIISDRKITSLTLSGGFLGEFMATGSKVGYQSPTIPRFAPLADLTIKLPKAVSIDHFRGIAA